MRWLLPALAGATSELCEDPGEGLQGGEVIVPGGVQRLVAASTKPTGAASPPGVACPPWDNTTKYSVRCGVLAKTLCPALASLGLNSSSGTYIRGV